VIGVYSDLGFDEVISDNIDEFLRPVLEGILFWHKDGVDIGQVGRD
jgi:hypothetical protein